MEKKFITVFGLKMCNALLRKGFHVVEVGRDRLYPENCVFFFRNSQQIKKAIEEISKK